MWHAVPPRELWLLLALALGAAGGLALTLGYLALERRQRALELDARRARLRLDRHGETLQGVAQAAGWRSTRADARVITLTETPPTLTERPADGPPPSPRPPPLPDPERD